MSDFGFILGATVRDNMGTVFAWITEGLRVPIQDTQHKGCNKVGL